MSEGERGREREREGAREGKRELCGVCWLWSRSRAEQSAEPGWASGVSGLRGLRGQGLLAVGDIKPSD